MLPIVAVKLAWQLCGITQRRIDQHRRIPWARSSIIVQERSPEFINPSTRPSLTPFVPTHTPIPRSHAGTKGSMDDEADVNSARIACRSPASRGDAGVRRVPESTVAVEEIVRVGGDACSWKWRLVDVHSSTPGRRMQIYANTIRLR